jgi:general nucleoside transport system permease protein
MSANFKKTSTQPDPSTVNGKRSWVQAFAIEWQQEIAPLFIALFCAFLIGGLLILLSGDNPLKAYAAILKGAFGDSYGIASTIARGLPIVGSGIAAGWAYKAGLWNFGTEGQLLLGGLAAFVVAGFLPLSGSLGLPLAILSAMVIGGLWALIAGWFETQFEVPILISSLLMNFIVKGFVSYMINFPLLEIGGSRSQTQMVPDGFRLSRLVPGTSLSSGLYLIIGIVIITTFVQRRTAHGFDLRIFGANREFAIASGVNPKNMTLKTVLFSGMMAGVVGAILVLGVHFRLIDGALTGPAYAWTGMMAAILANNNPIGIVIVGLFFSSIQIGASAMERSLAVPFEISFVVQSIIILLVASREVFRRTKRRSTK